MAAPKLPKPPTTIEITNFGGRLTRVINGDLNSGLANFVNSFGYDPFSKPGNLIWLETPVDITGGAITDLILDGIPRSELGILYIYAIGSTGKLYKIQPNSISNPNVDSVVGVASVKAGNITFNYGASMELFNYANASVLGNIYLGGDAQVNEIKTDGSAEQVVATGGGMVPNRYRPLALFAGKLIFGNGNTIAAIDNTNTVSSPATNPSSIYSQLNPLLPPETYITDLDVSTDGTNLIISTSGILNEQQTNYGNAADGNLQPTAATSGNLYFWNGVDPGATSSNQMGKFSINALQSYFQNNMLFISDSFGSSVNNGSAKLLTLTGNKSPFPNGTDVNGNFLTWITVECPDGINLVASLYYFGQLDEDNQPGLFRMLRYSSTLSSGFIAQTPLNIMVNSASIGLNSGATAVEQLGYGKHYLSIFDANNNTNKYTLQRFCVPPTGTGTAQGGVYQTQTQLFSHKITIKQIRVYTEPTVNGNHFGLKIIGSDGNPMIDRQFAGFYFQYVFQAGTDVTKVQGSLDRIDYNPQLPPTYAMGIQIVNQGVVNMTIHKIEVDYEQSGR